MEGEYLTVTLPSKRQLFYYRPAFEDGKRGPRFTYWGPKGPRHEWAGGLLTENIVQAVARDILVHAMSQAEKAGFHICMHVHDEIIAELSNSMTHWLKGKLIECMTEGPAWAEGLPLAAELKVAKRYA
jgi:DNA polymerase